MENQTPQSETIPSEIFKETLKNELNLDDNKINEKIVKIAKCNVYSDIENERNKILKDIKSNMTFGLKIKIGVMVIIILGFILSSCWLIYR